MSFRFSPRAKLWPYSGGQGTPSLPSQNFCSAGKSDVQAVDDSEVLRVRQQRKWRVQ